MFLADILFPKMCLGCGFLGCYICLRCEKKLSYLDFDTCLYCSKRSLFGLTHPGCLKKNGVDGVISIFAYNNFLKKIIKNIKYSLALEVWQDLSLIIPPSRIGKLSLYKRLNVGFKLQSIPLHPSKLRVRGFNQAELIADFFNDYLNLEKDFSLQRIKETKPQSQMRMNIEKQKNIKNCFIVKKKIGGDNYILVDDLITSGATIKEAARLLKKNGAKRVFALALAKG